MNLGISKGQIDLDPCSENELLSAILLSLFSDRRVSKEELDDPTEDQRGYWGDLLAASQSGIGSKLWLLQRKDNQQDLLEIARIYTTEALQWMIDDGLVNLLEVTTGWDLDANLAINITVDGSKHIPISYSLGSFSHE